MAKGARRKPAGGLIPTDPHAATLARLRGAMAAFDRPSLLAAVAGLTTLPENAGWHLRLRFLAELAASLPEVAGLPAPKRARLIALCIGSDIDFLMSTAEDPAEQPLTEPIAFKDRAYTTFLGQSEEVGLLSEILFNAINRLDVPVSAPWVSSASALIASTLALSDAIAARLGVRAGTAEQTASRVLVPSDISALVSAVTWKQADLDVLGSDFSRLMGTIGSGSDDPSFDGDFVVMRPLAATNDGSYVVFPDLLLPALRLRG